ncbi:ATP-dependent nuclease [Herbaspirillum seropedicae]|uniref:ATP-dependent nuclease n=1 Tax=Herbaspirillum seropedicae TaxID=964 RepID=UPI0028584D10|nr:AAA family ATPase [Herbaspirillum seropedicae]MDR6397467.1 putative ATPase [Herbaspirillum seropedicae]
MARIRKLQIQKFRSIHSLDWAPSEGINCLIGPGDSGKSTILDAIDLCLGARRSVTFTDTDFYLQNVSLPIVISVTLGALPDSLKNFDVYGDFLRGFNLATSTIEDEPGVGLETVITLVLSVSSNLEPNWTLYSERAEQQLLERSLAWKDRAQLAPARIGAYTQANLSWSRNSVLNRLTDEKANLGAELADAAREARSNFGAKAGPQLQETLEKVNKTAKELGVRIGNSQALLDAHSVSIGDGAIALHNESGIPLRALGTGSSRLLVAGLQRAAADAASIALVDEVEYGLEPHRLTLLLDYLGAKEEKAPPLQVFLTTHSPVALRELQGSQLYIVRPAGPTHSVSLAGTVDAIQSTLRSDPEAFLAKHVIVCEGASEVGLIRGLDQYAAKSHGSPTIASLGGGFVNVGGGHTDKCFERGTVLAALGYSVMVLVDADKAPTPDVLKTYEDTGYKYVSWRPGRALEDELFLSLPDSAIDEMLKLAAETVGEEFMAEQIQGRSKGKYTLIDIKAAPLIGGYTQEIRNFLGEVSRIRGNGWYKSVTAFEKIGRDIVGPNWTNLEEGFKDLINKLWDLTHVGRN